MTSDLPAGPNTERVLTHTSLFLSHSGDHMTLLRPRDAAADVGRRGRGGILKGRKEVFSERLEGEQGLGGNAENKRARQQTARRGDGGHKASFVSVLAAALAAALRGKKEKLREKSTDARWHGGLNGPA